MPGLETWQFRAEKEAPPAVFVIRNVEGITPPRYVRPQLSFSNKKLFRHEKANSPFIITIIGF